MQPNFNIQFAEENHEPILKWGEIPHKVFHLISHDYHGVTGQWNLPAMVVNLQDEENNNFKTWAPISLIKKIYLTNPICDIVMIKNNGQKPHFSKEGHFYHDVSVNIQYKKEPTRKLPKELLK